ncbi:MAG: FAD-dependent oxidoreductase [Pseudomonadota bacterium]
MTAEKIAIVGAGLSGSVLARILVDAGFDVTVFEKSGGTGGRLATRRTDFGAFNHGAQYLTAKSAPFRAMLTGLSNAGSVHEWVPTGKDRDNIWHVGTPGMSGLVKPLLNDIVITRRTRVSSIDDDGDFVALSSEEGILGAFDRVIVTAPAPQAYELLSIYDPVFQPLASVRYGPCWTLMAVFEGLFEGPDIFRGDGDGAIGWMAKSFQTDGVCGYIVQAGAPWSREHLEMPKEDAAALMIAKLQAVLPDAIPVNAKAHRWRYALVEKPLGTAFLGSRSARVFCAGDGMLGARAENAFESARLLADHLKNLIRVPK